MTDLKKVKQKCLDGGGLFLLPKYFIEILDIISFFFVLRQKMKHGLK